MSEEDFWKMGTSEAAESQEKGKPDWEGWKNDPVVGNSEATEKTNKTSNWWEQFPVADSQAGKPKQSTAAPVAASPKAPK